MDTRIMIIAISLTGTVAMAFVPELEADHFNVTAYGAVGDGETHNGDAFHNAVESCQKSGGGTIFVPSGRYVTSPIVLYSNMTLHLAAGAVILGSTDWSDYPIIESRFEGINRTCYSSLIQVNDADNVAVVGRGTIDGRGAAWWQPHKRYRDAWRNYQAQGITEAQQGEEQQWADALLGSHARPRLVEFLRCTNVRMEGVTLKDSASWTLHPVYCENVAIHGLTITAPDDSRNTDGINPDSSRNVRISDCFLDTGDDCIAIKSGKDEDGRKTGIASENITITNCVMYHGHGGVVIGSEMSGDVRRVVISNCIFDGTKRGIRLKTQRGRGGVVEDISVSNVIMNGVREALRINMFYHDVPAEPVSERTPRFRKIYLSNVTANDVERLIDVRGLPEMPVEDLVLDNVRMNGKYGARLVDVDGVTLRNVRLEAEKELWYTENVANLKREGVETIQRKP